MKPQQRSEGLAVSTDDKPHSVFLSHSLGSADAGLLQALPSALQDFGVRCVIADRGWRIGLANVNPLETAIAASDCVVAVATVGGSELAYVNLEAGIALDCGKPFAAFAEEGVDLTAVGRAIRW